jgi:hypothetical protein
MRRLGWLVLRCGTENVRPLTFALRQRVRGPAQSCQQLIEIRQQVGGVGWPGHLQVGQYVVHERLAWQSAVHLLGAAPSQIGYGAVPTRHERGSEVAPEEPRLQLAPEDRTLRSTETKNPRGNKKELFRRYRCARLMLTAIKVSDGRQGRRDQHW